MTNIGRRSIVAEHPDRAAIGDDLVVYEVSREGRSSADLLG